MLKGKGCTGGRAWRERYVQDTIKAWCGQVEWTHVDLEKKKKGKKESLTPSVTNRLVALG